MNKKFPNVPPRAEITRHRVDLHVHAWGARLLATLAAHPSCAADALQALRPRGAEAAGVEAQEGKTTMLLPRLYAGLQKGLEDTGTCLGLGPRFDRKL